MSEKAKENKDAAKDAVKDDEKKNEQQGQDKQAVDPKTSKKKVKVVAVLTIQEDNQTVQPGEEYKGSEKRTEYLLSRGAVRLVE